MEYLKSLFYTCNQCDIVGQLWFCSKRESALSTGSVVSWDPDQCPLSWLPRKSEFTPFALLRHSPYTPFIAHSQSTLLSFVWLWVLSFYDWAPWVWWWGRLTCLSVPIPPAQGQLHHSHLLHTSGVSDSSRQSSVIQQVVLRECGSWPVLPGHLILYDFLVDCVGYG